MHLPLIPYLLGIAARTVIALVALVAGIHFFGKRGIGEMNLLDVLMILLIGNAVQNGITTGSGELGVGVASLVILLAVDWLFGWLTARNAKVQQFVIGEAVVIATDGELDRRCMDREGVNENQVKAAMREIGLVNLSDVRLAVLEDDGSISIVPRDKK